MKKVTGILGLFALVIAMAAAIISTSYTTTQAAKGTKAVGYWIKYDCNLTNPQPVHVPQGQSNFILSDANPYSITECPDEVSKCAVKFSTDNVQQIPGQPEGNLRPINPALELGLVRCAE